MDALVIDLRLIGMTIGALRGRERALMDKFGDRGVTIDTVERAVHRGLESFLHQRGEGDASALDRPGKRRILMTLQAVRIAEWFGSSHLSGGVTAGVGGGDSDDEGQSDWKQQGKRP
jgi:hypothetical protein